MVNAHKGEMLMGHTFIEKKAFAEKLAVTSLIMMEYNTQNSAKLRLQSLIKIIKHNNYDNNFYCKFHVSST